MRWRVLVIAVFLAAAAACAGGWSEMYAGLGSGRDRESACGTSKNDASFNSISACIVRGGRRTDEFFTECTCSPIAEEAIICNVRIKVGCEK